MTDLAVTGWGSRMGWVVRLIEMGTDKPARSVDVLEFGQPRDFGDIASLGLTLAEAKQLGAADRFAERAGGDELPDQLEGRPAA